MGLGVGLVLLLALPAAFFGAVYRSAAKEVPDEPPIEVPPSRRSADPSSWTLLTQAMDAADDDDEIGSLFQNDGSALDPSELSRWQGDAEALALLDRVAVREGLSVPIPRTWDEPLPDMMGLIELRASQRLRAADLEHQGRTDEALQVLVDILKLGALMKDGEVHLIGFMVGSTWMDTTDLHAFGLRHSRDLALQTALDDALRQVVTGRSGPRALALECRLTENTLRHEDLSELIGEPAMPLLRYDADDTIAWLRRDCRMDLEQAEKALPERVVPVHPAYWEGVGLARLVHNPMGRLLMDQSGFGALHFLEREDEALEQLAALRALTAVRAGREPDLGDPMGGTFLLTDTELSSAHDGFVTGQDTLTLRWPVHPLP